MIIIIIIEEQKIIFTILRVSMQEASTMKIEDAAVYYVCMRPKSKVKNGLLDA
jgi:hypothetical protein